MSGDRSDVRRFVMQLLSVDDRSDGLHGARFDDDDWQSLLTITRQHRLGPLLHNRLITGQTNAPVPDFVRKQWQASHRRMAMRALKLRHFLSRLSALLGEQHIDFLVLKGGWLAFQVYPDPALRPMRDIDILVQPDRATEAWDCLVRAGFVPGKDDGRGLAEKMVDHRHLTALRAPGDGPSVEIHFRLNSPERTAGQPDIDPAEEWRSLLDRSQFAGQDVHRLRYLSPTDNLLHLVVHATLGDHFSNGPLVYQDLAHVIRACAIDWPHFWQVAKVRGWTRAAMLMLTATQRLHGSLPIAWPEPPVEPVPDTIVAAALDACLADLGDKEAVGLMQDVQQARSSGSLSALVMRRISVPTSQAAARLGMAKGDRWARFAYPIWLTDRLATRVRGMADRSTRSNAAQRVDLLNWLTEN